MYVPAFFIPTFFLLSPPLIFSFPLYTSTFFDGTHLYTVYFASLVSVWLGYLTDHSLPTLLSFCLER